MFLKRLRPAILSLGVLAASFTIASATTASAQDNPGAFFKGKTVRIVVGYGPGGGYDIYARMIAPYLEKELGAATVIVENQPGAGGLNALNRIYIQKPQDGTQMMLVNGTAAALGQLLEQSNVRYDLTKVGQLGIVSAAPWMWLAGEKASFKTAADAMKATQPVRWGGAGLTDGLSDGASITCEALQLKCKIIMGYQGSSDVVLALSRGEVDSMYISDSSSNNYVKAGQAKPIAAMSRQRSKLFPDVPTIYEAVQLPKEGEWWVDFRAAVDDIGRMLVTSPGVPAERLQFMQQAVEKALTNPDLIAEGEKTQRYVDYVNAQETSKLVDRVITEITPEQRKQVQTVVLKKYH
jgi:tripartite-type tricarboxylate transporter receptor subunit TctC